MFCYCDMTFFKRIVPAFVGAVLLSCATSAQADPPSFLGLPTLGGLANYARNITADGSVIVGDSQIANGDRHSVVWTNGVAHDIGGLGGSLSAAVRSSADGSAVVGASFLTGNALLHAYRWDSVNGMVDIGTLGGDFSIAQDISADGNFITGYAALVSGTDTHAFLWNNGVMQDLGTLGGHESDAYAVSDDGAFVAGDSLIAGNSAQHAFRWDSTNGMVDLGTLGGDSSQYGAMSSNGAVVAGNSYLADNSTQRVFRWENGTMSDIGTLGGNQSIYGAMSGDGNVIVGNSEDSAFEQHIFRWKNGTMSDIGRIGGGPINAQAVSLSGDVIAGVASNTLGNQNVFYRWTEVTGIQYLSDILTNAGIDYTGWSLEDNTNGMMLTPDGKYLIANSYYNGNENAFLFSMDVVHPGITTPATVVESLHSVSAAASQTSAVGTQQIGQTLFMARNINAFSIAPSSYETSQAMEDITPAAGGTHRGISLYSLGGFGMGQNNDFDNQDANGTIGLNVRFSDSFNFGVGVLGATSKTDLAFGGTARTTARGISNILSYEPQSSGLRLYGAAFVADLSADRSRGYLNGSSLDFSRGKTDGLAYGGAAEIGWQFPLSERSSLMPYADVQISKTKLDAYTETGGAFPASFAEQSSVSKTTHLGIEHKIALTPKFDFTGRLAWGHRWDDGGDAFTGTSAGLTQTLGGAVGDKNWAEAAIGFGWQATDRLRFNTEVSGRSGNTSEPAVNVTFGASLAF